MSVEEAKEQLAFYRQQQRTLRRQIEELRRLLRQQGIDLDPPAVDLNPRNKAITVFISKENLMLKLPKNTN